MKVTQLQSVACFEKNEGIVLSVGQKLQDLQKRLGGQLLTLNVPDGSPPEMPRAVLRTSDTVINVCFNRFDIATRPPKHISTDFASVSNFSRLRVEPILSTLFSESISYSWTGTVVDYSFPRNGTYDSAIKAIVPIYDKLINIERNNRELASFQLQYGFKDNGLFKNFNLSGYETRNIDLKGMRLPPGRTLELDVTQFPIAETGLQLKADINNRSAVNKVSPVEDFRIILKEHERMAANLLPEIGLPEDLWS